MYCNEFSLRGLSWKVPAGVSDKLPGIPKIVSDIAARRGIEDFKEFLNPSFTGSMPDPYTMVNMEASVKRVADAIFKKEKIFIYGDYDVDGATSSALMLRYLKQVVSNPDDLDFHIPDRLTEGYGPNSNAMKMISDRGYNLVVIVDSGTTAFEALDAAQELGLDVVILDHHQAEEKLPYGTLVNPKRLDETGELSYLCAAGLVFLHLVALQRHLREQDFFSGRSEPNLNDLLGIVALGTIADVVPLVKLNRAYVKLGLPAMEKVVGLRELAKANEMDPDASFTTGTCGFILGPCINAAGRIDDTKLGTKLLITDDQDEAEKIAISLVEINKQRRELQTKAVEEAIASAEAQKDDNVIIVQSDEWHPGVVGIVASRLKDIFDRTTFVIGEGGKGSARAIDGFNVGECIIEARNKGILISGGGHSAAGGVGICLSKLTEFKDFMEGKAEGFQRPALDVDLALECGSVKADTVRAFDMLAPFGQGNTLPKVTVTNGVLSKTMIMKGKHIKGWLKNEQGSQEFIMFNVIGTDKGEAILQAEGKQLDLYGQLKLNEYAGRVTAQIFPEDFMIGNPISEDAINSGV